MRTERSPAWCSTFKNIPVHDRSGHPHHSVHQGLPSGPHAAGAAIPESQKPNTRSSVTRCISPAKCNFCIPACPYGSIRAVNGALDIDCTHCNDCETIACASACPAQSLIVYGKNRTVEDVLHVVAQDSIFYSRSGGGMTISGGEPLFQKKFALALLREARRRRIKTAIETCGCVPWETMEEAAPFLNNILFDVKHTDSEKHKWATGRGNELILSNLKKLLETFPDKPVLVRTPVIPRLQRR